MPASELLAGAWLSAVDSGDVDSGDVDSGAADSVTACFCDSGVDACTVVLGVTLDGCVFADDSAVLLVCTVAAVDVV